MREIIFIDEETLTEEEWLEIDSGEEDDVYGETEE